jgi:hypothetical protein
LGIASFVIALLAGGLHIILAASVATNIASAANHPQRYGNILDSPDPVTAATLGGAFWFACVSCLSMPVCLVGLGLAIAGLVAHRGCHHVFTWIGLLGNGVVIVGILGLSLLSEVKGH